MANAVSAGSLDRENASNILGELPFSSNARFRHIFNIHVIWGPDYGKNSPNWRK